MSQAAWYGEDEAEAISPYVPPVADRASNVTDATPEPVSDAFAASPTAGPPTVVPVAGSDIEPVGAVLSTRIVRSALVPRWPEPSVARTRRS